MLKLFLINFFVLLIFFSFLNSGCSDFRQAIGKEKFIVRNDLEKFTDPDYVRIYGREGQWVNRRFGYLSDGILANHVKEQL